MTRHVKCVNVMFRIAEPFFLPIGNHASPDLCLLILVHHASFRYAACLRLVDYLAVGTVDYKMSHY